MSPATSWNWAAGRSAELIAAELCNLAGSVEFISRIEGGVAEELVRGAVELTGAGASDCVDYAACRLTVVGGRVGGDDGEFLDRVDAKVGADDAAGTAVGIVVDTNAVHTVVILLRARSSYGELIADAAVGALVGDRDGRLGPDGGNAGLQIGELSPVATIEREFYDGTLIDDRHRGGGDEVDIWRCRADDDLFGDSADLEREVYFLLCTDIQLDALCNFFRETFCGDRNRVRPSL